MPDNANSSPANINYVIQLWAILGPVIVGAITAWWTRKNQLADRRHELTVAERKGVELEHRRKIESLVEICENEISETKERVLNFIDHCNSFHVLSIRVMTDPQVRNDIITKDEIGTIQRGLVNSFNELFITVANQEIIDSSIKLQKNITEVNRQNATDESINQYIASTRKLKGDLLSKTQRYVAKTRKTILKTNQ